MRYDLIIIGGGLVGAGLATALRETGLKIALVDARMPSNDDPRLFALNVSSAQFLKNIHLWPLLETHATAIHQVHVSQQGYFGAVRLNREEVHLPALGFVIPARYIEAALNDALLTLPHFTLYRPATLKSLTQQSDHATLVIETETGEKTLEANIVIGADGTESTVRAQLNIPVESMDYQQSALVTRTSLKRSHHHVAYERFNAKGAIAMLPLGDQECATIWSADNHTIANLMSYSDEEFVAILQKEFGYRLGALEKIGKRHVFPLRMMRAKESVNQHVFLLGNAAHTLHPIAAQGFNLALYEVAALVEGIKLKLAQHASFTAMDLDNCSQQTQKQQAISMGVSHRLSQMFLSDSSLVGLALQLGMVGLNVLTPVKRKFIEKMLGRSGNMPALLME